MHTDDYKEGENGLLMGMSARVTSIPVITQIIKAPSTTDLAVIRNILGKEFGEQFRDYPYLCKCNAPAFTGHVQDYHLNMTPFEKKSIPGCLLSSGWARGITEATLYNDEEKPVLQFFVIRCSEGDYRGKVIHPSGAVDDESRSGCSPC